MHSPHQSTFRHPQSYAPPRLPVPQTFADRPDPLLTGTLNEFVATATLAAAASSYVFARHNDQPVTFAGPIATLLPRTPHIFPAIERALIDLPCDHAMRVALSGFYQAARVATETTAHVCHDPNGIRTHNNADWTGLAQLWRGTAQQAFAVTTFAHTLPRLDDALEFQLASIGNTMKQLRLGQPTNIARDGYLFLEGRLDRRAEVRLQRTDWIKLTSNAGSQRCHLKDVSRSGFGLAGVSKLTAGMPVKMQIVGRELMQGLVVWASDGAVRASEAGVRLLAPLAPGDPLLKPSDVTQPRNRSAG